MLRGQPVRLSVVFALVVSSVAIGSSADDPPARPISESDLGLPLNLSDGLVPAASETGGRLRGLRPAAAALDIVVIGTGVDPSVFPAELRARIASPWGTGDAVGAGTYATTVLLQLLDEPAITSLPVYRGTRFDAGRLTTALRWVERNAERVDAILYAAPPSDLLDPTTLLMADGGWDDVLDALGDHPRSTDQRRAVERYRRATTTWNGARDLLATLAGLGVPMVVPAGDLGPNLQTILGIATLPEVITVGAADGRRVARTSGSGPAIDMSVKPDVVAPAGIVGLLPPASTLADVLPLDPDLTPSFGDAPGTDRTRTSSTLAAAAVIASQVAALRDAGATDAARIRGALTAAAEPIARAPVWRQGAGLISGVVDPALVERRPVALAHGDLGREPARGGWRARIPFSGEVLGARTDITHFIGLGPDGTPTRRTAEGDGKPVHASVGPDGVILRTGTGERFEAGLYCGTTTVALPRAQDDASPRVSGDGLPAGLREHVPTCLLDGSRLTFHGFYIHDEPAESLTHALLPDLPERETVVSGFPKHLPMDPTKQRVYQKVTNSAGNTFFSNVPPGYYRFRQFADFGAPIAFDVHDLASDSAIRLRTDIGENPSYQDVEGFLLSATGWSEADMRERFGATRQKDGSYVVPVGDTTIRVVLDFLKHMPGPSVTSRVIDLIGRDDFTYGLAAPPAWLRNLDQLVGLGEEAWPLAGHDWLIDGVNAPADTGPDTIEAVYNGARALADARMKGLVTVMRYPFNLTTPNYTTDLSINFAYRLRNAAIVAVVQIGDEVESAAIVDGGIVRAGGSSEPPAPITVAPGGDEGLASFDLELFSLGAREGTLTLMLVPAAALGKEALGLSDARIDELSMSVATWTDTLWPAAMTPHGQGHTFTVDPNVGAHQMDRSGCRPKVARDLAYTECEDWTVLVHTPGSDATLAGVVQDGRDVTAGLRAAGAVFVDPRRGVQRLDQAALGGALRVEDVVVGVNLHRRFETNGRFWEQLQIPLAFSRDAPGRLTFQIVDNGHGRSSGLFPHRRGRAQVAPYIPYEPTSGIAEPIG